MKQKVIHKRRMILLLAVMAALSFGTFHIILKAHPVEELGGVFVDANWRFVMAGVLCMGIYFFCETESIRTLMKAFQVRVSFFRATGYSLADFYFSAITPSATGGQPMQLYYMTRDGYGISQSSFALLLLAAVYQLMVLAYGLVMIIFRFPYIQSQSAFIQWLLVFGILVNGICAGGIFLIILKRALVERLMMAAVSLLTGLHIIKNRKRIEIRVGHLIEEYSRGGDWLRHNPAVFLKVACLTLCRLTALFLIPYFAGLALGIHGIGALEFIAVQAILSLAVTAVPLPGSVGASEGSFLLLYQGLLPSGKSFPLMLLSRGISFYGFLVISGFGTLILHFWERKYRSGSGS